MRVDLKCLVLLLSAATGVLLGSLACEPPSVSPGPAVTVVDARVVLDDEQCRVVTLVRDGGVEESLCLRASDVRRAYDWHAKREAGCP